MEFSEAYHQLSYYTLDHPRKDRFIHQHSVDAHTAQMATADDRPISLLYALVGLHLALEKDYTGREVQLAHLDLARDKSDFPPLVLPAERGEITVADVLGHPPGLERDDMILRWCAAVWRAYAVNHAAIRAYCSTRLRSAESTAKEG